MSAWIVENENINNIVNSFYWLNDNSYLRGELKEKFNIDIEKVEDEDLNKELKKFGQMLADLNQYSVNERYNQDNKPFKFVYSDVKSSSIFQFLMSIQCLKYQSCEGYCEEKEEFKFLRQIEDTLKSKIISEIPEYQKAEWK